MRATLLVTTAVAVGLAQAALSSGWAADTPDASQIIQQLTPGGTTRGIRLGQPPATARPDTPASTGASTGRLAPTRQPSQGGQASQGGEANLTVPFASGSSTISPAAERVLNELGQALTSAKLAQFKFRVEGHTDTVGSPETNKTLSEQRAASVTEYLETKFNIDKSRLESVGMGEEELLVATGPQVASAANRRVRVVTLTQ
jgi:OOP family OmpA-OmpF porin